MDTREIWSFETQIGILDHIAETNLPSRLELTGPSCRKRGMTRGITMGPAWMSYDTLRYAIFGYGYCMVSYDWHWRLGIELKACTLTQRFAKAYSDGDWHESEGSL